ncbi:MAG TPA: uracil-DNA glycosylase [Candidatus Baltobacteraceae bacterium]|nr:uracil-DNA glycosylase [Candidatus Baltobacteraceae bacterium]
MTDNPRSALATIVGQVRAHLEAQRLLGVERLDVSVPPATIQKAQAAAPTLDGVRQELGECTRCKLHAGRKQIVFGVGNPNASLVFVGEAPGADEDAQGEPFVGRAGQLLTKIIEAMGLKRDDVYICNIIKCRPPNNRTPEADEILACQPFLLKQLEAIRPKFICALGAPAAQTLLQTKESISRLRGKFFDFHGIRLLPTFHPAFLLRNPSEKKTVWEDMKLLLRHMQDG